MRLCWPCSRNNRQSMNSMVIRDHEKEGQTEDDQSDVGMMILKEGRRTKLDRAAQNKQRTV